MKIAFFDIEEWEKNSIDDKLKGNEVSFITESLTQETITYALDADIICIFIYSTLGKEILEKLPHVKAIVTRTTGYDHIDIDYCKAHNITVMNVPTYGVHTVAEQTFGLILSLTRKLIPSIERTRKGDFTIDGLRGIDLYGKTLGVIGAGKIGHSVVEIAVGFGMKVLIYSHHEDAEMKKMGDVTFVSLDELLGSSDIITLHLPLTKETEYIVNKENIGKIKKGAFLINTARGGLIETEAVVQALEQGILAGAGLDVLEEECYLREEHELLHRKFLETCNLKTQLLNHALLDKENVLITPHNAFNTKEAVSEILDISIEDIKSFLQGKPQNTV